jgi:hypothetical protein
MQCGSSRAEWHKSAPSPTSSSLQTRLSGLTIGCLVKVTGDCRSIRLANTNAARVGKQKGLRCIMRPVMAEGEERFL